MTRIFYRIGLHLHDEVAAGGGTSIESPANGSQESPETVVVLGKAPTGSETTTGLPGAPARPQGQSDATPSPEIRQAEYQKVREQYKDLFESDLQQHLGRRLKSHTAEARLMKEILNPLMVHLGVPDMKGLKEFVDGQILPSVQGEESYKQLAEAMAKGDGSGMPEEAGLSPAELAEQGTALKAELARTGQDFDLEAEIKNPEISQRVERGYSLQDAYLAAHHKEIVIREATKAAEASRKATIDEIRSKGINSVAEQAAKPTPRVVYKNDPRSWTEEQFAEVQRKVRRGESVSL